MIRAFILLFFLANAAYAGQGVIPCGHVATASGCSGGSDGAIGSAYSLASDPDNGNATYPTLHYSEFTPTTDGTASYCHYAVHYADSGVTRCVLMDTSGNVLDYSAQQPATGTLNRTTIHAALTNNYCLVTGTTYLIGVWMAPDNYAGPTLTNNYGSGYARYKTGSDMAWSSVSFDLSSYTSHSTSVTIYSTLNNSASTP
jgi:hypothetical protein